MNHYLRPGSRRILTIITSTNQSRILVQKCLSKINCLSQTRPHSQVPVIKIPKYLEPQLKDYEKRVHKHETKLVEKRNRMGDRRIPIITSKRKPQYNHYLNQVYEVDKKQIILVSDGWKSGEYKGDVITFHPYVKRPEFKEKYGQSLKQKMEDVVPIDELGLSEEILEAISQAWPTIRIASEVQRIAIPEIQSGQNVICCAETGSGKTLAYAAPIVESILRSKKFATNKSSVNQVSTDEHLPTIDRRNRSPRALVVVPSRELAIQTANVFRKLCDEVGLGVATLIGGEPIRHSHTGFDIVVTTIGLVDVHVQKGVYSLHNCRHLVIDEADTLLDDSFDFNVLDLLAHFKFKSPHTSQASQLIMVSATLPQDWKDKIEAHVDSQTVHVIKTNQLHKVMKHVRQKFYRLHKTERNEQLIYLCKRNQLIKRPTIIFSNTSQSSSWVWHFLNENGVPCAHLCKSMTNQERVDNMNKFQSGELNFLACTDLASRGIDTVRVTSVINFDSPHFVSDYIHRAGRTGRLGSDQQSEVITFVSFKQDVDMLNELEKSVRLNLPINNVDANIKRNLNEKEAT